MMSGDKGVERRADSPPRKGEGRIAGDVAAISRSHDLTRTSAGTLTPIPSPQGGGEPLRSDLTISPSRRLAIFAYVVALADDALVLGHRLSEWSGQAPLLEEDIALSNLALDLIGQARLLYVYAGEVEGAGRDEDALAYRRDELQFANILLVEQPNGDFATTMARHLIYAAFMHPYFQALARSRDVRLAEIGAKAEKEMAYHVRHAGEWMIRLGDGTEESRARASAALDELWTYTGELFVMSADERALAADGIAVDRASLRAGWEATMDRVLREATLPRPADGWMQTGGRDRRHSEHLGHLLADMQVLHRAHPGAEW